MIRISDARKWDDIRHRQLSLAEKAVYDYWWDKADDAGFYKISDPDIDVLRLGSDMNLDLYRNVAQSLCKPRQNADGDTHRGWLRVKSTVWCSHFLKHTQKDWGQKNNPAHKPVLKLLVSYYDQFKDEPEYLRVLESIKPSVWDYMKIENPLVIEKLNDRSIPQAHHAPKPSTPANYVDQVMNAWNEVTGYTEFSNAIREKNIRERLREGFTLEHFKQVFEFKFDEWKDKPEMASSLTIDTMLKPQHFQKYLEQSKREEKSNEITYISKHG